jgi:hypothetical protein
MTALYHCKINGINSKPKIISTECETRKMSKQNQAIYLCL